MHVNAVFTIIGRALLCTQNTCNVMFTLSKWLDRQQQSHVITNFISKLRFLLLIFRYLQAPRKIKVLGDEPLREFIKNFFYI